MKNPINPFLIAAIFAISLTCAAQQKQADNSTNRFEKARVDAITDDRISIIATSGVDHLIRIDSGKTIVVADGKKVAIQNLHEGDMVSIDLDAANPVMFASRIEKVTGSSEVASSHR